MWALEDVRLETTLASKTNAFVITNAATVEYSDVSLELEFIELSDEAMSVAMQSMNSDGTMSFHSNAFRAYTSTIATGSSGVQAQLVNAKFASLKTLYSVYLESLGTAAAYGTTSRTKGIQSYQVKVGSMLVPQAPLRDVPDMFLATQMANHNGIASMSSKQARGRLHSPDTRPIRAAPTRRRTRTISTWPCHSTISTAATIYS